MRELGLDNVKIQAFDGTVGWSEVAPFDRILVTAGAPAAPEPLLEQLAPGGRLLLPEGDRERAAAGALRQGPLRRAAARRRASEVAFVPLVGRLGWEAKGAKK